MKQVGKGGVVVLVVVLASRVVVDSFQWSEAGRKGTLFEDDSFPRSGR